MSDDAAPGNVVTNPPTERVSLCDPPSTPRSGPVDRHRAAPSTVTDITHHASGAGDISEHRRTSHVSLRPPVDPAGCPVDYPDAVAHDAAREHGWVLSGQRAGPALLAQESGVLRGHEVEDAVEVLDRGELDRETTLVLPEVDTDPRLEAI